MFAYPCNDNAADEGVDKKVDGKADSEDIIEAAREAEVVVVQERGVLSWYEQHVVVVVSEEKTHEDVGIDVRKLVEASWKWGGLINVRYVDTSIAEAICSSVGVLHWVYFDQSLIPERREAKLDRFQLAERLH